MSHQIPLFTANGTRLASSFERVVVGDRGPYVEFTKEAVNWDALHVPVEQRYRLKSRLVFYTEYRSNDEANVKIYLQRHPVQYADYRVGMVYISEDDLRFGDGLPFERPPMSEEEKKAIVDELSALGQEMELE